LEHRAKIAIGFGKRGSHAVYQRLRGIISDEPLCQFP